MGVESETVSLLRGEINTKLTNWDTNEQVADAAIVFRIQPYYIIKPVCIFIPVD